MSVQKDTRIMDALIQNSEEHLSDWLRVLGNDIVTDIKLSFGTSPPGREYTHGSTTHVASQPDYPPNIDTGLLRASINFKMLSKLSGRIQDGTKYGRYLELGSAFFSGDNRLEKRPFITPVIEKYRKQLLEHAQKFGLVVKVAKR